MRTTILDIANETDERRTEWRCAVRIPDAHTSSASTRCTASPTDLEHIDRIPHTSHHAHDIHDQSTAIFTSTALLPATASPHHRLTDVYVIYQIL